MKFNMDCTNGKLTVKYTRILKVWLDTCTQRISVPKSSKMDRNTGSSRSMRRIEKSG